MELWFDENHAEHVKFLIGVERQLCTVQSEFQRIEVFKSYDLGRFLVIDGYIMLTERDEFIYHEMIAHVPMAVYPNARRVLVIGGGDGGTVRELSRYPQLERIDLVEIDSEVVRVCREYLPKTACGFDDPRVNLHFEDGLRFVQDCSEGEYDIIIVDSTDPIGPGEGLFTFEFYKNCYKALADDGIMVNQHETPFYDDDAKVVKRAHERIYKTFPICRVYQAHIPTYPSGHWLFGFASKKYHPVHDVRDEWEQLGIKTDYYNLRLHRASFSLPVYVERLLKECEVKE